MNFECLSLSNAHRGWFSVTDVKGEQWLCREIKADGSIWHMEAGLGMPSRKKVVHSTREDLAQLPGSPREAVPQTT